MPGPRRPRRRVVLGMGVVFVVAGAIIAWGADWATVDIAEEGTGHTQRLAVAHVDPAKVAFAHELERRYPANPNATTGAPNVMRTGRTEFYPEISRELLEGAAADDEHRRILRELDLRSALVVPLRGKGPVFGAITFVYAGSERRYTPRDVELCRGTRPPRRRGFQWRWCAQQFDAQCASRSNSCAIDARLPTGTSILEIFSMVYNDGR